MSIARKSLSIPYGIRPKIMYFLCIFLPDRRAGLGLKLYIFHTFSPGFTFTITITSQKEQVLILKVSLNFSRFFILITTVPVATSRVQ